MSFVFIGGLKKSIAVSPACRVLDVSRSGYFSAVQATLAARKVCTVSAHLKEATFAASGRTYGNRRLCAALQSQGFSIGRHPMRSLMRANQLRCVWRRKHVHHRQQARHASSSHCAGQAVCRHPLEKCTGIGSIVAEIGRPTTRCEPLQWFACEAMRVLGNMSHHAPVKDCQRRRFTVV